MKKIGWNVIGYCALILSGLALFVTVCLRDNQTTLAVPMRVSFQGEYKIADGEWRPLTKGESISAMDGEVTLKGYFQKETSDGTVIGRVA